MDKLKTIYCFKCGKPMSYPYVYNKHLYHKECIPFTYQDKDKEKEVEAQ
jgi:hypothetical protein